MRRQGFGRADFLIIIIGDEKFGWTLNFWNIAGVPYLYCFQLCYVLKNQSRLDEQQSRRSICNAFPIYWSLYAYGYESLY